MNRSPFYIPVADLVAEPGGRREVSVDAEPEWTLETASVGPQLHADLVVENASSTIVVRGSVATSIGLACQRCLTEWSEDLSVSVTEALGMEEEDGYVVDEDGGIDLEPMLRDAVLLEIPLRPLCRDDCLGLCGTCGADLNTGACPGHDEEPTTPFAVLRDLLEP